MDKLAQLLNLLTPRRDWCKGQDQSAHFLIDDIYSVTGVGTVVSGTLLSGTVSVGDQMLLGPDSVGGFTSVQIRGIHNKRVPVRTAVAGQTPSFAIKKLRKKSVRKGMVLVDPGMRPKAVREFTAEILVLHHPTTIQIRYEPVVHCHAVAQSAQIVLMDKELLRTGDRSLARFRFKHQPEFVCVGDRIIFRDGGTKGIGRIVELHP
eukprot:TRINITY_DN2987_c0_g1_i10.p2 TRINITY_DN2987_c0_g1~~TRINITY_DN2987_c0_g1_i10.p2  ORF type:complete len:206 (-),score=35.32 TRINITY_DN2987_c0_g1_i10:308-925(-)